MPEEDVLRFTVDTQLFRELGELLVGRDSTALIELIKNSYDADATVVTVVGGRLDDPNNGTIAITDDGIGMTSEQFVSGFLRIASRAKSKGERRSPIYHRRYTGAKGIGRLAAHKLARKVSIESTPSSKVYGQEYPIIASIDWTLIESHETLDELEGTGAIGLEKEARIEPHAHGTKLLLEGLRRKWSQTERNRFLHEVSSYTPPSQLVSLPSAVLGISPLFKQAKVRDNLGASDPGFSVQLGGDFVAGEEYWKNVATVCSWVLEIDALRAPTGADTVVKYRISPTASALNGKTELRGEDAEITHPDPSSGPFFQARIMIREGSRAPGVPKSWLSNAAGIRVYMEGFRVLPYGDRGDDWLGLDREYKLRSKTLVLGEDRFGAVVDEREGLSRLSNESYLGAVFLTANDAPNLRMLVNREGFIPEHGFYVLVELIKQGLDFATRIRARENASDRDARRMQRENLAAERATNRQRMDLRRAVEESVEKANHYAAEARSSAARGDVEGAVRLVGMAAECFRASSELSDRLLSERSMMFVLASVGTQMTAFIHEIRGMLSLTHSIEHALVQLRSEETLSPKSGTRIGKQIGLVGDLRRALERQSAFFFDVAGADARRRRERQPLRERFQSTLRYVHFAAMKQTISILNGISHDAETPPMFSSEISAVLTNLLSNAVKAAGENGQIEATSFTRDGKTVLVIANTGARVNLRDAEKWFRPYETTLKAADSSLGQGMGMGLPITRNLLGEYGATISFVTPAAGFATAVEVVFEF